jgi:hypothetical protein
MKFKKDPSYATVRYYYEDETSSDTFLFKRYASLIASSLITEDGRVYLNLGCFGKPISIPDELLDNGVYPYQWCNIQEIEWLLKNQPFDILKWNNGTSMYSLDFWRITINDLRDIKINFIKNSFNTKLQWIHAD